MLLVNESRLLAHRPADLRRARARRRWRSNNPGTARRRTSTPATSTGRSVRRRHVRHPRRLPRTWICGNERGTARASSEHVGWDRARQLQRASNLWVWDSTFVDCATGVTNATGSGNFHVYNSVFERSTVRPTCRWPYGRVFGARQLLGGLTCVLCLAWRDREPRDDPPPGQHHCRSGRQRGDPARPFRVPGLLLDNTIQSPPGAVGPVVTWEAWFGSRRDIGREHLYGRRIQFKATGG